MAMRRRLAHWLLCSCILPGTLAASGTVSGTVSGRSDEGSEPLIGVIVLVKGTVLGTTTNAKGEFRLPAIPAGSHTLVFSIVGYQRVSRDVVIADGRETTLSVALDQTPVQAEQIIITASKRAQSLQDVPASISVMDAAQIKTRNSLTIDDALRYVPGVNITGFQLNIRGSSGYSRGAGSRVLMLLDGIPFITGDTGELNFESIPIGQVDRIEVVKGASSALYGSNALGGVVNIITKDISEIPETDIRTYGGFYNKPSYDQWKWTDKTRFFNGQSFTHARKSGDLGVVLFLSRQFDDGYRQNDYHRRYNFYIKTKEDLSPLQSLTLNFGLLYQYGGQYLYWRNLDSALIPPIEQETDNVKSIRYYTSGSYNTVLAENFLLNVKGIWYHNDWGYETIHAIGRTESLSDAFNLEVQSTYIVDPVHTLTMGLDSHYDKVGADAFGNRVGGGLALYAQDEIKLSSPLTLTAGARFDFQSLGLTGSKGQLNPKAAVAYRPWESTAFRASVGRGFRIPSVAEAFLTAEVSNLVVVPNNDLKPERSWSYELGVSQSVGDWGTFDVAAFRSDYDDLIEAGIAIGSGSVATVQWRNVTKARVQGVETSWKIGLFDGGLQYHLGYTYVYPEDITRHDILKYRPRHLFYTGLEGHIGPVSMGADFRYLSRVDRVDVEFVELGIIPDGDERQEIFVTDFRLGTDFSFTGFPLTARLNVNNAFQRNYIELIGNIMPPRTYTLVLEAHL